MATSCRGHALLNILVRNAIGQTQRRWLVLSSVHFVDTASGKADTFSKTKQRNKPPAIPTRRLSDPLPIFLETQVQKALRQMTGVDLEKLSKTRKVKNYNKPFIKLASEEDLKKENAKSLKKVDHLLQMPPFMSSGTREPKVLSKDPAISPVLDSSYAFIDISQDITSRDRFILKREQDGTLREASSVEREKLLQIYFPVPGRSVKVPPMFTQEVLSENLERQPPMYLDILTHTCVQFEPDSDMFINVTQQVYEHINKNKQFDELRSTRFFGPMAFYFAWHGTIANLLGDMLAKNMLSDAALLVSLRDYIHQPQLSCMEKPDSEERELRLIENYIKQHRNKEERAELSFALKALKQGILAKKKKIPGID